jgi:hypothetical protein
MYLRQRLDLLIATQNPDGGWGYFPGRCSWLEPTAYAMLALHGDPRASAALDRAWVLVRSWQLPDGSWRPAAHVWESHWSGALAITLHAVRGIHDGAFHQGTAWLLRTAGKEDGLLRRLVKLIKPGLFEYDPSLVGWPWRPGNSSWVEPTAHTLIALKKAAPFAAAPDLARRIKQGEGMLLDRRCSDGGWNYGTRRVYQVDLTSYEESTALALLGLQGMPSERLSAPLGFVERLWRNARSPLARAWMEICLRNYQRELPETGTSAAREKAPRDILLAAIQALGCPQGQHRLLKVEVRA